MRAWAFLLLAVVISAAGASHAQVPTYFHAIHCDPQFAAEEDWQALESLVAAADARGWCSRFNSILPGARSLRASPLGRRKLRVGWPAAMKLEAITTCSRTRQDGTATAANPRIPPPPDISVT